MIFCLTLLLFRFKIAIVLIVADNLSLRVRSDLGANVKYTLFATKTTRLKPSC